MITVHPLAILGILLMGMVGGWVLHGYAMWKLGYRWWDSLVCTCGRAIGSPDHNPFGIILHERVKYADIRCETCSRKNISEEDVRLLDFNNPSTLNDLKNEQDPGLLQSIVQTLLLPVTLPIRGILLLVNYLRGRYERCESCNKFTMLDSVGSYYANHIEDMKKACPENNIQAREMAQSHAEKQLCMSCMFTFTESLGLHDGCCLVYPEDLGFVPPEKIDAEFENVLDDRGMPISGDIVRIQDENGVISDAILHMPIPVKNYKIIGIRDDKAKGTS